MNSAPRILFLVPLPPPVHGSAVISEQIRNSELIRAVFDCDFINISSSRSISEVGKIGVWLGFLKLSRLIGSLFECLRMLLTKKYDLCYCAITCHGKGFLKDSLFILLCKLFGCKVVLHQHNKGMRSCIDRWPYRWLIPYVYKGCKVILLSWRLYPDVDKVVAKDDVMICPNGIPVMNTLVKPRKIANEVPHLLYLSNLIVSKGVYTLLDACKILKDKGVVFICDFVGGETKEISSHEFEKAVRKRELDGFAVYHGPKYGTEKSVFLKQADIFVFPTFYFNETFGLVNLEAMQYGLPIVSTDEGGIPDVVRDMETGLISKSQDSQDLADKLELLLNDIDLRNRLGKKGRDVFYANYTLEAFENRLNDCLCEIIGI